MYASVLPTVAPVFLIPALGLLISRVSGFDRRFVGALVMNVGAPALVFSSVLQAELAMGEILRMLAAGTTALALFAVAGAGVLRAMRLPLGGYLPSLMFPNTGNLGLAVVFLALGPTGLAFGVAFSTLVKVGHFTIGTSLAGTGMSARSLYRMPLLHAFVAALALHALGVTPPEPLMRSISLVGDITIPLMLLSLGASLSGVRLHRLPRSSALAVARVVIGFGAGVAVATLFELGPVAAGTLIIQCTMPVAVFNYLFAERYDGPVEDIAGMIVLSTLLVFALLPALLAYVH